MYKFKNKNKNKYSTNIIIFFIILLIFLILFIAFKKYKKKNIIQEHYLTYFLPYYNPNLDLLSNFYLENDDNKNYVKKHFNYKQLVFTSDIINSGFLKILASNFIANSTIVDVKLKIDNNTLSVLDDLNNNKISFSINNITNLVHYTDTLKKDLNNIRLINYLYKEYLYFFTKKSYGFTSLDKIPTKCKIGILAEPNPIFFLYKKLLDDLKYKENDDYTIIPYKTLEDLFVGFRDNKCQLVIILDVFPNKKISTLLDQIAGDDMILIPFDINNETLYLRKNYFLSIDYIDLNKLSKSFLPKSFGKYEYNIYKPSFKCCSITKILLTNNQTDTDYIYNLTKFLGDNYRDINNSIGDEAYNINPINIDTAKTQILDFHHSALKYFKEKGYIGYYEHINCKYLAGTTECTEQSLKDNNLYYSII